MKAFEGGELSRGRGENALLHEDAAPVLRSVPEEQRLDDTQLPAARHADAAALRSMAFSLRHSRQNRLINERQNRLGSQVSRKGTTEETS